MLTPNHFELFDFMRVELKQHIFEMEQITLSKMLSSRDMSIKSPGI